MKLHIPSLKVPHITKTVVLVSAAILLILALVAYGAVRNVQAKRLQAQKDHDTAIQQAANKQAVAIASARVQADLNVQTNKALAACSVLKQYSLAPATKKLVVVPPICSVE